MATATYEYCRCPGCKMKLDEVETDTENCPGCGLIFESRSVWMTRKYPGVIVLPGWLTAFGWPVLLILAGLGFGTITWFVFGWVAMKAAATMIGLGLVWFMIKLVTNGES